MTKLLDNKYYTIYGKFSEKIKKVDLIDLIKLKLKKKILNFFKSKSTNEKIELLLKKTISILLNSGLQILKDEKSLKIISVNNKENIILFETLNLIKIEESLVILILFIIVKKLSVYIFKYLIVKNDYFENCYKKVLFLHDFLNSGEYNKKYNLSEKENLELERSFREEKIDLISEEENQELKRDEKITLYPDFRNKTFCVHPSIYDDKKTLEENLTFIFKNEFNLNVYFKEERSKNYNEITLLEGDVKLVGGFSRHKPFEVLRSEIMEFIFRNIIVSEFIEKIKNLKNKKKNKNVIPNYRRNINKFNSNNKKKKIKKRKDKKEKKEKKNKNFINTKKINKIYKEKNSEKKKSINDLKILKIDLLPKELYLIKKLNKFLKMNTININILILIIEKINNILLLPLENLTIKRLKLKRKIFSKQNSIFNLLKLIRKLFLSKFYVNKFFEDFQIISIKKNYLLWITIYYKLNNCENYKKLTFENESLKLNVFDVNLFFIGKFFFEKNDLREVFFEFKNLFSLYYYRNLSNKNPFFSLNYKKNSFFKEVLEINKFKAIINENEIDDNIKTILDEVVNNDIEKKCETIVIDID